MASTPHIATSGMKIETLSRLFLRLFAFVGYETLCLSVHTLSQPKGH